jgi:hypothetical protein
LTSPILTNLHDLESAREQQSILRNFYAVIKNLDPYLRFALLTGVSKFSRTSIFSGLNNLKDISNTAEGAVLLGYTQEELESYFHEHIYHLAAMKETSAQQIIEGIKLWYNGYRFSVEKTVVYNPYSTLLYLDSGLLQNYWFETGTPSFLINVLREKYRSLEAIATRRVSVTSLGTFDIENIPLITIFFQTGYLTIKDYNSKTQRYYLGFPNREVRVSFYKHLLSLFIRLDEPDVDDRIDMMKHALETNKIPKFCKELRGLFANIPIICIYTRKSSIIRFFN